MTPEEIAKGLSAAQRRYLRACGDSKEPYTPRHGVTANWALRHDYAEMRWSIDGVEMSGEQMAAQGYPAHAKALGCRLTDLGRAILEAQNDRHDDV